MCLLTKGTYNIYTILMHKIYLQYFQLYHVLESLLVKYRGPNLSHVLEIVEESHALRLNL